MEFEEQNKTSKYNSGIAQLYRLDGLWRDVNTHSRQGLFTKWNEDLDRIWCELARDLPETDKTNTETEKVKSFKSNKEDFDKFDSELAKLGDFQDHPPAGFVQIPNETKINRNKQYKILIEKELFLRRLENKLGKGTAWDDEDEDSFD